MGFYRFWKIWINILVLDDERESGTEAPPSVQTIDSPEDLDDFGPLFLGKGLDQGITPM